MQFEEYVRYDAVGLAQLVRDRSISPEEPVAAARAAIERGEPLINAVVELWPEVTAPDLAYSEGALFGVPFLIKDIGMTRAGRRQELGSRLALGRTSAEDTDLMFAFDRLGLVALGRTALPEFAYGCTTESQLLGPTRNPWDPGRMVGGSSGGAAASVAAGYVPLAHGNDGAGSIRGPAACCGLIGLKPSRGRVSCGPVAGESLFGFASELALTRSIRDTALVLDGVSRPMPGDPFVIRQPEVPYSQLIDRAPRKFRIGYTCQPYYNAPIDSEVIAAVEQCARLCADLGHNVEEARPTFDYTQMREACMTVVGTAMARMAAAFEAQTGRKSGPDTLETATLAMLQYGRSCTPDDIYASLEKVNSVSRSVGPFFDTYDLLLTPATAKPAQPLGTYHQNAKFVSHEEWFDHKATFTPFLALFNVTGNPAISLPTAMSTDGLPIGAQFVARAGREEDLLMIGRQLEIAIEWEKKLIANTGNPPCLSRVA